MRCMDLNVWNKKVLPALLPPARDVKQAGDSVRFRPAAVYGWKTGNYPITSNLFAVYALFLYFSRNGLYMNYKVIAFLIVCIAVIAAAGCLGLPSGNGAKSSSSQEGVTVSPNSAGSGLSEERFVGSGSTGAPAVPMPATVTTPSPPGSDSGST